MRTGNTLQFTREIRRRIRDGDPSAVKTRDIDGDFRTHLTVPMRVYVRVRM